MKHITLPLLCFIIFQLSIGNLWSEERCFMKVADMRVLENPMSYRYTVCPVHKPKTYKR